MVWLGCLDTEMVPVVEMEHSEVKTSGHYYDSGKDPVVGQIG